MNENKKSDVTAQPKAASRDDQRLQLDVNKHR